MARGGGQDYTDLTNKPSINDVTLEGNKSLSELGVQPEIDSSHKLSADNISDGSTNKVVTASEKTTWNGKQDTLVSGENIKTINNTSLLGSGNITISGGGTLPYSLEIGPSEPTNVSTKYWIDTNPPFSKMKIGCLGDSITAGVGASTTYVKLLEHDFRQVVNYGVSGSCITTGANNISSFCQRAVQMAADLDAVIIFGGTNDLGHNANFGTDDNSTDATVFKGAVNVLITSLMDRYPEKPILFCLPTPRSYGGYNNTTPNQKGVTLEMIRNQIIARCEYYSMPYLDLYGASGINASYSSVQRSAFTSDGLHLNNKGHKRIYDLMISKLKEITNNTDAFKVKAKQNNTWVDINASYVPEDNMSIGGSFVDERVLQSISATYTQGSTKVYPDTPLNDLKTNLVVLASYDDGSTETVASNAYTLSGTLAQGTSTVTVTYLDKTTTFTVNVSAPRTVTGIDATYTQGSTVVYPNTSLNDLKGNLTVVKQYNDGTSEHLAAEEYTLSGTLTVGTSTVTVTYQTFTDTFEVVVSQIVEATGIEATYTQGTTVVYPDTSLDTLKAGLVVVKNYNDGTSETLSADQYTLSGTLAVGTSTITVTNSTFTDTFDVAVTQRPELVSITAAYTQSGTVYEGQNLDVLRPDLVVTANYTDSSTKVVTDYTLTGSLVEGTSTIVVNYEGKTDSFNVTVTVAPPYIELNYLQGDGSAYILTDYTPTMHDSMEVKYNDPGANGNPHIVGVMNRYALGVAQYGYAVVNNATAYYRYGTGLKAFGTVRTNQDYTIKYTYNSNRMNFAIDDEVKETTSGSTAQLNLPISIFAMTCTEEGKTAQDYDVNAKIFNGKIYYAKFWDEQGTLIKHFVPARRTSDNALGMLDKVNNTFYTNAGTGTFTAGE